MKILHIIPSIDKIYGGPAETVVSMVDYLNRNHNDVDLLSTSSFGSNIETVDISRIQNKVTLLPRNDIFLRQYIPSLRNWLNDHIYEFRLIHIHSFFNYMSHVAMTCARRHKVPYVLRPAGMLGAYDLKKKMLLKKFWINFLDNKNLGSASAFHATSIIEKKELEEKFPLTLVANIPHGIHLPKLTFKNKINTKEINLLFLSRLNKKKNIPSILKAVSRASAMGINIKLKIAGEPNPGDREYRTYLQKMSQDLDVQNFVEFCGFLSGKSKEEAFKWADVFILPSFDENFGVAVMEALSFSVPVIVSPQVALSQEIREFGGGWVTDERSPQSPDSILKILKFINQNRNLILSESKKARSVAERFSWKRNSNELMLLYKSLKVF
jgi:glycosyltransferase involved in cell wall biosynthesis